MPFNNEVQQCLICTEKCKYMVSLRERFPGGEALTVAKALEELHFLTISDEVNLQRMLCLICVAKIQYCIEFKAACSQAEIILKISSENIIDEESIYPSLEPTEIFIKRENVDSYVDETLEEESNLFIRDNISIKEDNSEVYDDINDSNYENEFQEATVENGEFSCVFCDKIFAKEQYLTKHVKTHIGEKSFTCDVCGKSFLHHENLIQHKSIHRNEKKFTCSVCTKTFNRQFTLDRHFQIHSGKDPFKCFRCKKVFPQKVQLIAHLQVHNKEKRYVCKICNKSFSHSNDMKRHQSVHRKEQKFTHPVIANNLVPAYPSTSTVSSEILPIASNKRKRFSEEANDLLSETSCTSNANRTPVNVDLTQLKQCFEEFGVQLMENIMKFKEETKEDLDDFEIPSVENNKVKIFGVDLDAREIFRAKNAKTMRMCVNRVARAFWSFEQRQKLVLSVRAGQPSGRTPIKEEEVEKIKKICMLLQRDRSFDKSQADNDLTDIKKWISDVLKNDRRRPFTIEQKKQRSEKAKIRRLQNKIMQTTDNKWKAVQIEEIIGRTSHH